MPSYLCSPRGAPTKCVTSAPRIFNGGVYQQCSFATRKRPNYISFIFWQKFRKGPPLRYVTSPEMSLPSLITHRAQTELAIQHQEMMLRFAYSVLG